MMRFLTLFLLLLVLAGIDYGLQHYVENQWIVIGPILLLILFLYLRPRLKCGNCRYPTLKDSSGSWAIKARKNCSNCGAELKPFAIYSTNSEPRESVGSFLQLMSVLLTLFLLAVMGSLLIDSNGVTKFDLFVIAVIGAPISLLIIGAWVLGSKLGKPKSK